MTERKWSEATRAVRSSLETDAQFGAVVPPIYLSSNFAFDGLRRPRSQYDYSRSGNPTRDALARAISELEEGAATVVTATGLAAVTLALGMLPAGARVLAPHDCYGGTFRLLAALHKQGKLIVDFVNQNDTAATREALARRPQLVWIETPSNPLLRVVDIADLARAAHAAGALVIADNTFLSPIWQKPLTLGADFVLHSTTKYLNGHSDVVGGALVAASSERATEMAWWANALGVTGAPFDSFLTLRGVRTLHARMRTHEDNARVVAELLSTHPSVERVFYPGLASHPGHALAQRQQRGFGAMMSFELRGGEPAVERFLEGLECFTLAESLGGVESLIAHPATMTHASMVAEDQRRAGILPSLLRLSVGIEAASDLTSALRCALDRLEGFEARTDLSRNAIEGINKLSSARG